MKYENVNAIIDEFISTRLIYYEKRKIKQIQELEALLVLYSNKYKFIKELLDDTIDLRKKKSAEIEALLATKSYDTIEGNYNYLTKMHMDMVNEENVNKLKDTYETTTCSLETLKGKTPYMMYKEELYALKETI
jgi:DNA gyrase/topoisomerase IV subunit A